MWQWVHDAKGKRRVSDEFSPRLLSSRISASCCERIQKPRSKEAKLPRRIKMAQYYHYSSSSSSSVCSLMPVRLGAVLCVSSVTSIRNNSLEERDL
eukprot:5187353-Amphidinium_carterae.1